MLLNYFNNNKLFKIIIVTRWPLLSQTRLTGWGRGPWRWCWTLAPVAYLTCVIKEEELLVLGYKLRSGRILLTLGSLCLKTNWCPAVSTLPLISSSHTFWACFWVHWILFLINWAGAKGRSRERGKSSKLCLWGMERKQRKYMGMSAGNAWTHLSLVFFVFVFEMPVGAATCCPTWEKPGVERAD